MTKNLETLWTKYCGARSPSSFLNYPTISSVTLLTLKRSEPHAHADPSQPNEISMDGTMQYCADLGVDPSEVIMLALAWFTKAPTMGRFSKREWVEAWQAIGSVFPPFPFFFPLALLPLVQGTQS